MTRNTKLALAGVGLGIVILACNLTASGLTSQAGQTVSNVAFAQAMSEQAQANQQLAKAVQSVTHTMNLLLIVVLLLAILGAGLYVWKSQQQVQTPAALPAPETPLRVVYVPRPQLPEGWDEAELLETHSADLFQALTSGKEWQ
jgi:uncharacterized protein HemX